MTIQVGAKILETSGTVAEALDRKFYQVQNPVNLRYPQDVGNDQHPLVNFNTHNSSKYAKRRSTINPNSGVQDNIDGQSYEPYMFFEFMQIISDEMAEDFSDANKELNKILEVNLNDAKIADQNRLNKLIDDWGDQEGYWDNIDETQFEDEARTEMREMLKKAKDDHHMLQQARRVYGGSVALYMPNDIQINDQIVYNESSRKAAGALEGMIFGDQPAQDIWNKTVLSGPGMAAAGAGIGDAAKRAAKWKWVEGIKKGKWSERLGKTGGLFGGLGGAAVGAFISDEMQRHTGQALNPNEFMAYQSTSMRTFTFNWTFLPDNEYESEQATQIIKKFRTAAHARRVDFVMMVVPDHCIVSFHGAQDMIQLPPLVIESVNVTYNPNSASYFKQNNKPVEMKLSVGFKEIVPIYKGDVEAGL